MTPELNNYKEIIDKLERFVKKEYVRIASVGIETSILAVVLIFTFFVFLEVLFHFSSGVRTIIFLLIILIFLSLFIVRFIIPYLKYFNFFRKSDYLKQQPRLAISIRILRMIC